jgi:hypothetical protein
MRKSIIVVEGQTELVFTEKFITQLVALQPVHIERQRLHSNSIIKLSPRGAPLDDCTHIIRIIDATNDEKVNSYIEDNIVLWKDKGFELIYGLRDKFTRNPKKPELNINAISERCKFLESSYEITIDIIVAEVEIEAWFLSVPSFFTSIDEILSLEKIEEITGFDFSTIAVESLPHPSAIINNIFEAVGMSYKKRLADTCRIAELLDYETLYLEKTNEITALKRFANAIDNCLSPCAI